MRRIKYPACAKCGHTLNPNLEDDCEKYYLVGGEIYCKYCFEEWAKGWLDENMDEFASFAGIPVAFVEVGT